MLSQPKSVKFEVNPGQEIFIETGKIARQADGAVTVRQGNCILLATVVANKPASTGSDNQYISLGFNIEVDAATGSLTTGYNQLGYNWGMSYSAFDTSTLGGPYANVANPTLKTINGVEVYEFVGTYETGYNIIGVTDSTTPEPILITFRYE